MEKKQLYENLLKDAQSLVDPRVDRVANMANLAALIHERLQQHWTGFYRVEQASLYLGPFQGPVACNRIAYGKGVCGKAWQEAQSQIVADVSQFPGHIACSPASNSEIVVPCKDEHGVYAVLDIDSVSLNAFDEIDQSYLEQIVALL